MVNYAFNVTFILFVVCFNFCRHFNCTKGLGLFFSNHLFRSPKCRVRSEKLNSRIEWKRSDFSKWPKTDDQSVGHFSMVICLVHRSKVEFCKLNLNLLLYT
jgi:hypothetical protein